MRGDLGKDILDAEATHGLNILSGMPDRNNGALKVPCPLAAAPAQPIGPNRPKAENTDTQYSIDAIEILINLF